MKKDGKKHITAMTAWRSRNVTATSNVYETYCGNFTYRNGTLTRVLNVISIILIVLMTISCKNNEWIRIRHQGDCDKPISTICIMKGHGRVKDSLHHFTYVEDERGLREFSEYHFYVNDTTYKHVMDFIRHYQAPKSDNGHYGEFGSHVVLLCTGKDIIKSTWRNLGDEEIPWHKNGVIYINSKEQVLYMLDNFQSSDFFSKLLCLIGEEDELSQMIGNRIIHLKKIDTFYPPKRRNH